MRDVYKNGHLLLKTHQLINNDHLPLHRDCANLKPVLSETYTTFRANRGAVSSAIVMPYTILNCVLFGRQPSIGFQEASVSVRFLHGSLARCRNVSMTHFLNWWQARSMLTAPALRQGKPGAQANCMLQLLTKKRERQGRLPLPLLRATSATFL